MAVEELDQDRTAGDGDLGDVPVAPDCKRAREKKARAPLALDKTIPFIVYRTVKYEYVGFPIRAHPGTVRFLSLLWLGLARPPLLTMITMTDSSSRSEFSIGPGPG